MKLILYDVQSGASRMFTRSHYREALSCGSENVHPSRETVQNVPRAIIDS